MSTTNNIVYGYLFEHQKFGTVSHKDERLTVLRYFKDPITYSFEGLNKTNVDDVIDSTVFELVCDGSIGLSEGECFYNGDFTKVYEYLWHGIIKLKQMGSYWLKVDSEVRSYFENVHIEERKDENGKLIVDYVSFDFNFYVLYFDKNGEEQSTDTRIRYNIYYTLKGIETFYEFPEEYYIFYDDKEYSDAGEPRQRNIIEREDVYGLMNRFVSEFGVTNMYKGVYKYTYIGPAGYITESGEKSQHDVVHQDFYVFYTRNAPDQAVAEHAICMKLIEDKGGRDLAKFYYPNLFKDEVRRIFLIRENRGFPISYEIVNEFLEQKQILNRPEIINVLQWKCPMIVENGVSDLIPNYSPVEIATPETMEDEIANKFLFYLSLSLNYIDGTKNPNAFPPEIDFADNLEYDGFVEFNYQAVTWRIFK